MYYDSKIFKRAIEKFVAENKPDAEREGVELILDSTELVNNMINKFSQEFPAYPDMMDDDTIITRFRDVVCIISASDTIMKPGDWSIIVLYVLIENAKNQDYDHFNMSDLESLKSTLTESCQKLNKINEKAKTRLKDKFLIPPSFDEFMNSIQEPMPTTEIHKPKLKDGNKIIEFPPTDN